MTIALFRAFPDPYRQSMRVYADQLRRGLSALVPAGDVIHEWALPDARLAPPLARYWDQYVRYQRYVRGRAADVNHIVDHGYGHLAYSLPRDRTVVTFHDAVVVRVPGVSWRTRLALRHSLRAMRRVARVITASRAARDDFLELVDYPPDHVAVVPLGIDAAFRPPADRESVRRRLGLTRPTVLQVGHTQVYMNVPRMLAAFEHLVNRLGVDAQLVRVGDPLGPDHLAFVDRHTLASRVTQIGRVSTEGLREAYGAADVLLYAPLYAGFGLPPLEAMACGTPVVCSNRGSLPEIVGDAATIVDPLDSPGMAEAVAHLLTDERARAACAACGRRHAAAFTWDATARSVLGVYREIAGA
jgi:glycosyltransferase involved in cell wall biosynthesis